MTIPPSLRALLSPTHGALQFAKHDGERGALILQHLPKALQNSGLLATTGFRIEMNVDDLKVPLGPRVEGTMQTPANLNCVG
eukprot:3703704-Pyramimonas_sp.AAC.1